MPFTLLKGTFHVKGYSPDGDSLKFKAKRASNWKKLTGKAVKPNAKGHVQLRIEGIYSLETHYARSPTSHQPRPLAHQAGDELMVLLGITNVVWGPSHGRVSSANDGVEGFILARNTGPYGRPICFVFSGSINKQDGSSVYLDKQLVRKSANYAMLRIGHAYPLFYETLFYDLRDALASAVKEARSKQRGLWPKDDSNTWIDATDIPALEDKVVLFPKLYRRLIDHDRSGQPMSKLPERLDNEDITVISTVHHTHFDTVVEVNGKKVRMTVKPEDLVFK